jgi:alkyl hydroperoxide reductase subunit AhpF
MLFRKNARRLQKILGSPPATSPDGIPSVATAATSAAAPVKVAILGGGPAGVTAAIYAARAGLKPLLIAPALGGQLMSKGVNVENYPGLDGESGGDIIKKMKRQVRRRARS